jgi:3-oxoacyl-[acyl-carrier protein] reductase
MEMGLRGKRALVAGASAGIGRAIAAGLAREGCRVALLARRAAAVEEAARAIQRESGTEAVAVVADLTRRPDVARSVEAVRARFGSIDVLVTNTGGPPPGAFRDLPPEAFEEAFRLTFLSTLWLCHETVPAMIAEGQGGSIVMIASVSVKQPIDGLILSNTMRAGVAGLAKSLANEAGPHGIRVNVVCPGYTATERLDGLAGELARQRGVPPESIRAGCSSSGLAGSTLVGRPRPGAWPARRRCAEGPRGGRAGPYGRSAARPSSTGAAPRPRSGGTGLRGGVANRSSRGPGNLALAPAGRDVSRGLGTTPEVVRRRSSRSRPSGACGLPCGPPRP